jgi:REP element-mobilizing transposase RayT
VARPLRIEYPGAFYHVTSRGNERRTVFQSNRDREKYLSYLESAHERYGAVIHVYCLMGNHYHLLLETPRANLSKILHYINGAYTTYFNIKRSRSGHLFQGRFKGILVDKDEYCKELSRYVHLNPVRAGMVKAPLEYPWSSYRYFVDRGHKGQGSGRNMRQGGERQGGAEVSRPLRIEYPGAFYHVTSRGNERKEIFRGPEGYGRKTRKRK